MGNATFKKSGGVPGNKKLRATPFALSLKKEGRRRETNAQCLFFLSFTTKEKKGRMDKPTLSQT